MKLSFVIPCYGSQDSLAGVVEEIKNFVLKKDKTQYEIILVNDNSPDDVYSVIQKLAADDINIKAINMAQNFGQHSALMAGYNHVSGDIIISVDDDGQIPIEDTYKLIEKIEEGYDAVYANYPDSERGEFRSFGSKINDVMATYMLSKPKGVRITSYFGMKKFIAEEICRYKNPYPYLGGLVFRATKNVATVDVKLRPRQTGISGYTFKKLISLWLNGFTSFSIKPLRIASIMGFIVALIGAGYGIYIIINRFTSPIVPMGYSSIMAVLLFIGGAIMCMLGLIGEYIGRIYISISDAPQYVIKNTINLNKDKS